MLTKHGKSKGSRETGSSAERISEDWLTCDIQAEDKLEKANQTIEDLKTEIGDQKLKIEEQKATIQKQKIMIDDQRTTAAQRDEENIVLKTIAMSIRVPNEDDDDDEAVIARGGPLSGSGFFGEGQKGRCGGTEEGMKTDEGARKKRRVEVYGEIRKKPR